jgi:3-mercaptopyruvate sulfurtransferase SseA
MPCQIVKIKMSSDNTVSAQAVVDDVKGHRGMLILDCRSQTDYTKSHIKGAISIFLPSLMLRRLKAGKLNIGCIIQNNEAKDKFNRMWKTQTVVLYDEKPDPATASPTSVIGLLYKKLKQDGAKAVFLQGLLSFQACQNF